MAAETRKSRKSNFSQEEIDVLVTTVMQNHDILYRETSKSFFHKEIRNQVWNIILEEVNKVSLERRTLNEVKNKWKKCQYNLRTLEVSDNLDNADCDDLGMFFFSTREPIIVLFSPTVLFDDCWRAGIGNIFDSSTSLNAACQKFSCFDCIGRQI